MNSVSDTFWASTFSQKLIDFCTYFEPAEFALLLEVLKCAKWIFEQQSMHFDRIYSSWRFVVLVFWKQKSYEKLILKQIWIWDRFWSDLDTKQYQKLASKSVKKRVWRRPRCRIIFGLSWGRIGRSDYTQNAGGMREPKEGVTMSHACQAPFHGVGGC